MVEFRNDLVVAGKFNYAGGSTVPFRANNIARWDGSSWHSLGAGLNNVVYQLATYNGELIASGLFTTAGTVPASYIARWDGNSWRSMGQMSSPPSSFVSFDGGLIASGGFSEVEGEPAPRIARWDGARWSPFGSQRTYFGSDLVIHEGALVANVVHVIDGFEWPLVSRWTGSSWDPLGPGFDAFLGAVSDFEIYNDRLIAGGNFWGRDMTLHNIARWENSRWVTLGSGVSGDRFWNGVIAELAVYDGSLFVAGSFTSAGGKPSRFIARWDDVISAVQLESFDAEWHDSFVRLAWQFSPVGLQDLAAVYVERSDNLQGPYNDLRGAPGVPEVRMVYDDLEVESHATYFYRLRLLELSGQEHLTRPIAVSGGNRLDRLVLYPLRDSDTGPIMIRYAIGPSRSPVRLGIYSPTGQLVRSLDQGRVLPGEHLRSWDRRTQDGASAARGVYFVHLSSGSIGTTQKLVLLNR